MKTLLGLIAAGAMAVPVAVTAQETINLTVASSHPTVVPWVGMIQTHFMARTDEILAETGNYQIEWNEAFGGTLYKANATLSSVEEGITDSIKFIISATEIDKRRAFYKKLSKYAKVQIFDKPDLGKDGWEEQAMLIVRKLAIEKSLNFDPEALELFVMLAGADTRQVANELEKLDLSLGPDRTVTTDTVKQLVSQSRAGVVFELGSAIEKRDLPYALELIDQLLYRGESAIGILLAAIVPRVRCLMLAKDLQERCGISSGSYNGYLSSLSRLPQSDTAHLPKTLKGEINGYPLFLASRWVRNFELSKLRAGLEACLDANHKLVTTSLGHTLVLNRLVIGLLT